MKKIITTTLGFAALLTSSLPLAAKNHNYSYNKYRKQASRHNKRKNTYVRNRSYRSHKVYKQNARNWKYNKRAYRTWKQKRRTYRNFKRNKQYIRNYKRGYYVRYFDKYNRVWRKKWIARRYIINYSDTDKYKSYNDNYTLYHREVKRIKSMANRGIISWERANYLITQLADKYSIN